jgi:transcriptional regulator with XRE-family HTH domain
VKIRSSEHASPTTGERLRSARLALGYKPNDFAHLARISESVYRCHENDSKIPVLDMLGTYARLCNVGIETLMGDDIREKYLRELANLKTPLVPREKMFPGGVVLRDLREKRRMSQRVFASLANVPYRVIMRYEQGAKDISPEDAILCASTLGVSPEIIAPQHPNISEMKPDLKQETLGQRLHRLRRDANISLHTFSEKIMITRSNLQRIESGFVQHPSVYMIVDAAKILKCSVEYLICKTDEPSSHIHLVKSPDSPSSLLELHKDLRDTQDAVRSQHRMIEELNRHGSETATVLDQILVFLRAQANHVSPAVPTLEHDRKKR